MPTNLQKPDGPGNPPSARLLSLDAYRGLLMLLMVSGGLGLPQVAAHHPHSRIWSLLGYEFEHTRWIGCALWDLIQPSFMFMVGVALPYSVAGRRAKGDSGARLFAHTLWRSFALVTLGVLLYSEHHPMTNFIFTNVLAQIGLGYAFLFLLEGRGPRVQLATVAAILAGTWILFLNHPPPPPGFDFTTVGGPRDGEGLTGLAAHWDFNTNFAAAFDRRFLNLFPRSEPFRFNDGGYTTLNFVPSIATMALGLMAGELLRSDRPAAAKLKRLLLAGASCLLSGTALDPSILHSPFSEVAGSTALTLCPIVKKIWTPSWALFSAGWTFVLLAAFYGVVDILGWKRWTYPLVVVGTNSIAIYLLHSLLADWIRASLKTHLGWTGWFDGSYGPIARQASVVLVLWLVCGWMYRRKIFIKI